MTETTASLSGIRILDLTNALGVYATKLLADLGADVIRVEPPNGDPMRQAPPCRLHRAGGVESFFYAYMNTSKRAIALDLSRPDGRLLLLKLAASADAVIESGPGGPLEAAGIGYEELARQAPAIVHTVVTPFGDSGPWAHFRANDLVLMATGGLMWLGGEPDTPPLVAAGQQAYFMAGLHAATATLAAVYCARLTGEGQRVSVSAQECVTNSLENASQYYDLLGVVRKREGNRPRESGTGPYPTEDGFVYVMAGRLSTPRGWTALVEWLNETSTPGAAELLKPEWSNFQFRAAAESRAVFERVFTAFAAGRGKVELSEEGQNRGIVIVPVNSLADLFEDPQLQYRQFFVPLENAGFEAPPLCPGPPMRLFETPSRQRGVPAHDQHTEEVLHELGMRGREIEHLRQLEVIG